MKEPPTPHYPSPHDSYELDPDQPIPLKPPRPLEQVQCFLKEDIRQIAFREPDNYKAWCITADHSLMKADDTNAILISRTHTETHNDQDLIFCLLVFHPGDGVYNQPGVLFGELAMSTSLFAELVREIGRNRPLPQEARVPDEYDRTPDEVEDEQWAQRSGLGAKSSSVDSNRRATSTKPSSELRRSSTVTTTPERTQRSAGQPNQR